MGLPYSTVQRMFLGSLVIAGLTWLTQDNYTDAAYVLIALSCLNAIVWGLSEREIAFAHLGMNQAGILTVVGFVGSIALFAEVSIRVWGFPTTGSYICLLYTTPSPRDRG